MRKRKSNIFLPSITVRCTLVNVWKKSLSTPHQYVPESESSSWEMLTVKAPSPVSCSKTLPDTALFPGFTTASLCSSSVHGSLHKYLWFLEANLWEQRNETSPPSGPSAFMLFPSAQVAASNTVNQNNVETFMLVNPTYILTTEKIVNDKCQNDLHSDTLVNIIWLQLYKHMHYEPR